MTWQLHTGSFPKNKFILVNLTIFTKFLLDYFAWAELLSDCSAGGFFIAS
jgi:hypothetical protein